MRRILWIIFHPFKTAALLDERETIIRNLIETIKLATAKMMTRPSGPELGAMIESIESQRSAAFFKGVAAERRRRERTDTAPI